MDQDFSIVVEHNTSIIQLSEICMGIYFKYSIYEKEMSYLPLIVMAEGGMEHVDGQITDSKWTVPMKLMQDQGMHISDLQAYGFDFDDIQYSEEENTIQSKQVSEARFIKFTLRHPMTSLLEVSYFYQQLNKPINYTFQFISCVGCVKVEESID